MTGQIEAKTHIMVSSALSSTVENICVSDLNFIKNNCQQALSLDKKLKENLRVKILEISEKYETTAKKLLNKIQKIEIELESQAPLKNKKLDFLYKIGFDAFLVGVIPAIASGALLLGGVFTAFGISLFASPIAGVSILYATGVLCLGTFSVAAIIEAVGGIFVLLANVLRDPKVKEIRKDLNISKELLSCAKRNSTLFHQLSLNLKYLLNPKSEEILNNNHFRLRFNERANYYIDPEWHFEEIFTDNCRIPFTINSTQMTNYNYDPESPINKIKNLIIEKRLYQKTRESIQDKLISKLSNHIFSIFQAQYTVPTTDQQFHSMKPKKIITEFITEYVKDNFNNGTVVN